MTLMFGLSLSSISAITVSSLVSVSGLAEQAFHTVAPKSSISELPYCNNSHGCCTCMENRLSRIKVHTVFPLTVGVGEGDFRTGDSAALLMSEEKSLIFVM